MRRRLGEITRGLGALAFLLLLLVGPPVGLAVFVGWPLPDSIPSLEAITEGTRSGVPDAVIINTLAVVGWLAWSQLALAVLVEAVALTRRVRAPSLPVIPGVQLGAGRLLATAALLFGGLAARTTPPPLTSVGLPEVRAEPVTLVQYHGPSTDRVGLAESAPVYPVTAAVAEAVPVTAYTAQRHDTWWGIAEAMLGDGARWRDLRDLNAGNAMPDGQLITETTESLDEGWIINIPTADPPADGQSVLQVPGAQVVVERGDNLWELSEEHLEASIARDATDGEIDPYWRDVIAANEATVPNPDLIYPGQVIELPPQGDASGPATEPDPPETSAPSGEASPSTSQTTVPPPTTSPAPAVPSTSTSAAAPATAVPTTTASATTAPAVPVPTTTAPPTTTVSDGAPPDREEPAADEQESSQAEDMITIAVTGILGAAGTLIAAGLAAALTRRRRRRQQQLPAGIPPPDPPEEFDELRADIVRQADLDLVDILAGSVSTIAAALAERRSPARLRIIQAGFDRIEVLLSEPVLPAPEGWQADASGTTWVLDAGGFADVAEESAGHTHPLLVSLGRPEPRGQLHLDLEAEGLINVTGDSAGTSGFLRSVIHELSTSPFAGTATVLVVGDVPGAPASQLDRVTRVASWDDIADSALAWAHQTREVLAAGSWATPSVARAQGEPIDNLAPMVIVVDHEPGDERFTALCSKIGDAIVPVVVVGLGTAIDGATRIHVSDGQLSIPKLNLSCEAQSISADTSDQIEALLTDAGEMPEQLSIAEERPDERCEPPMRAVQTYVDPPFDVLVRVLGEIEVIGGTQPLTPMQTSVFVYLALHSPVASETVQDAIWTTPTENRKKRLANTLSESRPSIGAEHLPAATDGKYRVGPRVKTDLELFEARVARPATQSPEEAMETLRGALDLVGGPVFTYRNTDRVAYVWVDHENWISATELKVTNTAEKLAEMYLDAGDHEAAVWAARVGLRAAPTHTRLTDVLMRAHHAAGDRRAVVQVFESHVNALQKLEIDDVGPDLLDTYEQLRRQRRNGARS